MKQYDFTIFGENFIDRESIEQMSAAMKLPVSVKGALMPDAHVGYGLPIGGVLAAYNSVIPYGVGMDIGCRMCMSVYPFEAGYIEKNRGEIKEILRKHTRFGVSEFEKMEDPEVMERAEFREIKFLRSLQPMARGQLGTSGHGNHFVDTGYLEVKEYHKELDLQPRTYFAILSHSGSRNFGAEIARHYTRIAREKLGLTGESGKLAWLDIQSEEGQEYWKAMTLAGDYSATNHHIIHKKISDALAAEPLKMIENHHNFAWKEKLSDSEELIIHRKGATPAREGDTGIIPGSMISPAYVVAGKGNEESLCSAAHGAGRCMSRRKATKTFTRESLEKTLLQSGVELIGGGTDESPAAYKDIHQVMRYQKDLVKTLAMFYPKIVRME